MQLKMNEKTKFNVDLREYVKSKITTIKYMDSKMTQHAK